MRKRFTVSFGALAAMAVVSLVSAPLRPGSSDRRHTIRRRLDGTTNSWVFPICKVCGPSTICGVPMQRPEEFGERRLLNDKEFAEREAQNQVARDRGQPGAFRNEMGTRSFRQTSLVIAPANGRTPPLTPEADRKFAQIRDRRGAAPASWEDRSLCRPLPAAYSASILPAFTATACVSSRHRTISSSATRWCMTHASFPWTAARTSAPAFVSTWAMRVDAGKATLWSSSRPTSTTRLPSA